MFYVLQNESTAALRRVPILLTDAATGTTAQTGLASTQIFPYVNINGGAFAGGAGTIAEAGYGQYYYEFDPTEVATLGLAGIHITAVGCRDYDAIAQVAAFNVYSGAGVGITAGDVWEYVLTSSGDSADTTLGTAKTAAVDAQTNTGASQIRSNIWDFDIDSAGFGTVPPFASGYLITAGNGATLNTPAEVWSYATREITGGLANTVTSITNPVEVSPPSMVGIANTVWSTDVSTYLTPSAGYDLTQAASGGVGITAGDVWSFNITGFGGTNSAAVYATNTNFTVGNIETYVANQTPQDVWTYTGVEGRTITGGLANTVTSVTNPVSITTGSMTGIAGTVWSTDVSGYTSPSAGYDLANASTGSGITAGDVWNYTLTSSGVSADATLGNADDQATGANTNTTSPTLEANIWGYATRTLTSGSGITAGDVWSYATRTTTGGIVTSVGDKTGYSLSSSQTFNVTGNITGNVSGSVGSVTNPVDITTGSMSGTAGSVWNYVTRTLTSGGGITAGDVWSYVLSNTDTAEANLVTAASGAGITAGDVWSYGTRTITGGTADTVNNVTNGVTVSTNNDKTGYALSTAGVNAVQSGLSTLTQAQVGTEVDSSLSDVGLTSTVTGRIDVAVSSRLASSSYVAPPTEAAIANTVWSNVSRTITGGIADTVTSVTNPVSVTTGSMSGIANTVWTNNTRTLTSGAGATAGDIWNYNISAITASGTAGAVLNDASVSGSVVTIVNGPYRLTSIAEGTDGRIDILAESVQTIQLNCLDGFGQPFNVTGYTAAINVYDVSGALTVTYTPTVDFASSGIVSFDIDTDVTGTTGRYTLVVELTAGAEVVQLGPLEILVRPL